MKKFLLIILLAIPEISFGQYNLTLFQLHETVPQANQLNPGLLPNAQVFIGFPGVSNIYASYSNSLSALDIFSINENNLLVPDLERFKGNLKNQNLLNLNGQVDPLFFGFWAKKNYFSFGISVKNNTSFGFPGAFVEYVIEGNGGDNLGKKIELNDLLIKSTGYAEFSAGYGRVVLDNKLQWGFRAKYLKGIYHISTNRDLEASLYTDPETYAVTVKVDNLHINTAGLSAMEIGFFEEDSAYNQEEDKLQNYLLNNKNNGFALDVGASLAITNKFKVYGSIIDLGYINWQTEINNFSLQHAEHTYEGIDFRDSENFGETLLDSIEAEFKLNETQIAYTEGLSSKFYAGGEYQLGKHHSAGILAYGKFIKGKLNPAFSINYNVKFGRTFNTAITYSIMNKSYNNLGLGFSLNLGFLQVYAVTDNILAGVKPQAVQNADVRLGLNMTFGRKRHDRILNNLPGNKKKAKEINEDI